MPFDFLKLPKQAQRAAFAKMSAADKAKSANPAPSRKSLGSGARHTQLANRRASQKTGQLSPDYIRTGRASQADVDTLIANYRAMHGRDPSPKQFARIRRR